MASPRWYLGSAVLSCVVALAGCSSAAPAPGNAAPTPGAGDDAGGGTSPGNGGVTGNNDQPDSAPPADGGAAPESGGPKPDAGSPPDATPPPPADLTRVVAYLPNYSGSYSDWAKSIDFTKMTHMNLAFATANGSNGWDMGAADGDVNALVLAAHAAGVKVLASLGGGDGDQSVIAQYKDANNLGPLITNLDAFVTRLNLDGVDIDIEDPNNLGSGYSGFVSAVVAQLRPEGKLVTAAVAQYLQDSMSDATLHSFDFVNDMIYSDYSTSVNELAYYTGTKQVPPGKISLGAGFFGSDNSGSEYDYSAIIAADPNAWSYDQAQVNGQTVNYTGMASMKKLADYSKGFGGIMFWELSADTTDAHSLYKVIQGEM